MHDRWWRRFMPARWPRARRRPADGAAWAWLEPYPGPPPGPEAASMSLAFITALQQLPPRERAALVLSDVLDFDAADMAEILECEGAELDELLQRARAAMGGVLPRPELDEETVLSRFTGAFERGDVSGMTALLAKDAWLRMRPIPVECQGRRAARHFLAAVAFPGGTTSYRLVATRANGQPAFGCYLRDPATGIDHACGLIVLTLERGRIIAIDRFSDNSVLPRFGLPRTLPEDLPRIVPEEP